MPAATFDTLKFANALKAAGVPPAQAEAEAQVLAEALQVNLKDLVTKDDLKLTKEDLQREMADLKKELKQDLKDVRQELKDVEQRLSAKHDVQAAEMKALRAELKGDMALLKWMFASMITVGVGILVRLFLVRGPL
jgi:DNA repair exonuclease SbcCD ATPase subunit